MYYTVRLISNSKKAIQNSVPKSLYNKRDLSCKYGTKAMFVTKTYIYDVGRFDFGDTINTDISEMAAQAARLFRKTLPIQSGVKYLIIKKNF